MTHMRGFQYVHALIYTPSGYRLERTDKGIETIAHVIKTLNPLHDLKSTGHISWTACLSWLTPTNQSNPPDLQGPSADPARKITVPKAPRDIQTSRNSHALLPIAVNTFNNAKSKRLDVLHFRGIESQTT